MGRVLKISRYKPSVFQGALHFGGHRRGFSLAVEHPFERILRKGLFIALFALVCAYMYFVSATVLNVVARKEALSSSASLASAVSLLERDYYALAATIRPGEGERLGLSPVSETKYVHRPGAVGIANAPSNDI